MTAIPLDAVREDGDCTPAEKETSIAFTKGSDSARLFTAEAGLMRRVIAHPDAALITVTVDAGNGKRPAVTPDGYDGSPVVGVEASIPVGLLQVKSSPRKSDQHAAIVSKRVLDDGGDGA